MPALKENLKDNLAYKELMGRLEFHINATKKESSRYYHLMLYLQWGIPFISGLLTFFSSGKAGITLERATFFLGFLVTILTLINSTVNPALRYAFAVRYSHKFWEFKDLLLLELQKIHDEIAEKDRAKKINDLLTKKQGELAKLIRDYSQGPHLPRSST